MIGDLLYVKIRAFNKQTSKELAEALYNFRYAKAVVIDLRGCPGGMSGAAVDAANIFLKEGIIVSTQGKFSTSEIYYLAQEDIKDDERTVFILIDGQTASAAEIFAAAMQEQGRARIIGTQSKGKGTLQKLISLSGGGVLAITNSLFKTPSGRILNGKGITPDVCTFEQEETANVESLIKRGQVFCAREEREDNVLEMKIVEALTAYMLSKN